MLRPLTGGRLSKAGFWKQAMATHLVTTTLQSVNLSHCFVHFSLQRSTLDCVSTKALLHVLYEAVHKVHNLHCQACVLNSNVPSK